MPHFKQLMLNGCGRAVVALLYSPWLDRLTNITLVNWCEIEECDTFTLADADEAKVTFLGVKDGKMAFRKGTGDILVSDRRFIGEEVLVEDHDGRKAWVTSHKFLGGPVIEVAEQNYWWHLFYSVDEQRAMVAEIAHVVGQRARADYVNYVRYPSAGDTFRLGYRLLGFLARSSITFLGAEKHQLLLRGPDGSEFAHDYCHQRRGRIDGEGWVYFGPVFTGRQVVLDDQERYSDCGGTR
jgi:hypothetical protein